MITLCPTHTVQQLTLGPRGSAALNRPFLPQPRLLPMEMVPQVTVSASVSFSIITIQSLACLDDTQGGRRDGRTENGGGWELRDDVKSVLTVM